MPQSRTLSVGWEVYKESITVASIAQAYHAEVVSLGPIDPRQWDIDKLMHTLQSKNSPLICMPFDSDPNLCAYSTFSHAP